MLDQKKIDIAELEKKGVIIENIYKDQLHAIQNGTDHFLLSSASFLRLFSQARENEIGNESLESPADRTALARGIRSRLEERPRAKREHQVQDSAVRAGEILGIRYALQSID